MQRKKAVFRILLILIISTMFLLITGGKVSANDEYWIADDVEGEIGDTNWFLDHEGDVLTGEDHGIKWRATVTKIDRNDENDDTLGKVSFSILNAEEIQGEIELPDKIKTNGSAILWSYSYRYELDTIEERCISNANKVTKISFGKYVSTIKSLAFSECKSLEEIVVSKNLKDWDMTSFNGNTALKRIIVDKENAYFSSDDDGVLYNKDKTVLFSYPRGKQLEEYTIPNTVNTIYDMAFRFTNNLKKINISENVKSIGDTTFQECEKLEKVVFLENSKLEEIGQDAFLFCEKLKTINIPNSVKEIRGGAFSNCTNLKEVMLPSDLEIISSATFANCISLKEIELPKNLKKIEDRAFKNTGIIHIEIPKGLEKIGEEAFYECSNLLSVVLANNVKSIGANAFSKCNNNLVVYCYNCDRDFINKINANTTIIPAYALCEGVYEDTDSTAEYVKINKFVEGTCTNIKLLSHVYGLPVKVLEEGAFIGNTKIQRITIPNTVTKLGHLVFGGCTSLNNVVLPASIENLPVQGFEGCESLSKVVIKKGSKIGSIGAGVFNGCSANLVVYYDGENEGLNKHLASSEISGILRIDNIAPYAEMGIATSNDKLSTTIELSNIRDNEGGSDAEFFAVSLSSTLEGVKDSEWQEVNSDKVTKTVEQNGTWYIYLSDMVGNVARKEIKVDGIDETAPTLSGEPTVEYNENGAKITAAVLDETAGSGLKGYVISNSSNTENISNWNVLEGYSAEIKGIVTKNGTWYLHVKDNNENILTKEILVTDIDEEKPVVGDIFKVKNGIYTTVTIDISDNKALKAYAIDLNKEVSASTKWINIEGDLSQYTINYTAEANEKYYIHVKDKYGNINDLIDERGNEIAFTIEDLVDGIAPRVKFIEKTNNIIKVELTDAFSGIAEGAKISYAWGNTKDIAPESYKQLELTYEAGDKEVIFEVPCEGQGTFYLWLNIEELKDVEGNANTQGKIYSDSYTFDVVAPEIRNAVANKSVVKKDDTVIITIITSEDVNITDNIVPFIEENEKAQCELGQLTGQGKTWELPLTAGEGNGPITVIIPKEMFKDNIGNTLSEDYKIELVTIDNIAPVLPEKAANISDAVISQNQETIITFKSEEELDLVQGKIKDITVTDEKITGTIKEIKSEDGKTWNITIIGGAGDGAIKLKLPAGLFVDDAGNETQEIVYEGLKFDNTAPTIEIINPNNTIINSKDTVIFTVKASEPIEVDEENEGRIELKNVNGENTISCSVTVLRANDAGNEWQVSITSCTGNGEAKLLIPAGYFKDVAGNTNTVTEKTALKLDNMAPEIGSISTPTLDETKEKATVEIQLPENEQNLQYVVSKSETADGITEEWKDVTTNLLKVQIVEPGTYYVYIKDAVGNIQRTDAIVILENLFNPDAPTITIEAPNPVIIKAGQVATYTITASEEVVQVDGKTATLIGAASEGSTVEITGSGTNWVAKVTAGNTSGEITLVIPQGYFKDLRNKAMETEVAKTGLTVDNIAPSIKEIKDPVADDKKEKATVEIDLENNEEKLQYVVSKSETIEGITEEWKNVIDPFKVEITEPGTYYIYIKDEAGNIAKSNKIEIPEVMLDAIAPTVEVKYETVNGQVKAIITANEQIQAVEGWNYANDIKTIIEKVVTENTNTTIEIKDLAGNVSNAIIDVKLISEVSLDKTVLTLEKGKSQKLVATINPEDATNKTIKWSSSNSSIVTVDTEGNVTAVTPGTATITVTTEQGNKTKNCEVTVLSEEGLRIKLEDDSNYNIDQENSYIENISPKTTIEAAIGNIDTNGTIKVYKATGEEISKEEMKTTKIGTGMTIKITKGTEEKIYTVIVKGDATGDGQSDFDDMKRINNYRLFGTITNFGEAYQKAADVNGDGKKDFDDMKRINNYRLFGTKL